MIGKCCVAAVLLFAGTAAAQTSTTVDVPIVVTHGAPLTTFTFVNNSGKTLPAGSPVSFGQAFRYGDVMPGNHPVIRDAATHVPLAGQQWDEISTWRENGGNGSWRHAVWAIDLPNSLAAGATYQVEFVVGAGAYSQSPVLALSALCSGPNSHDLKIHLTDVRNQDDTVRRSGDATFDLCDNIANTGRDAPRILDQGSVVTTFKILGRFLYTDATYDPLLYAECNVGLWVDPATGNSLKDTQWVCLVHNSWMTVKAGSTGHAGNPGPAGLTNDPQALSYRPEVLDGASSVFNFNGLDATVASASNPIKTSGCGLSYNSTPVAACLDTPSSTGVNAWYLSQGVRVTSTGTPAGGLTNGQFAWIYNTGSANNNCTMTNLVSLVDNPGDVNANQILTSSQGSGNTTFSFRVWHTTRMSWLTLNAAMDDNWSPGGTATAVQREVLPAFTLAEKQYWEQSGIIEPIDVVNQNPSFGPTCNIGGDGNYHPFTRGNVIGGNGVGYRPDLGFPNDYAAQAWVNNTPTNWTLAKLFSIAEAGSPYGVILDEATGRIPVLNNGPPVGPGGNGIGDSYGSGTNSAVPLGAGQVTFDTKYPSRTTPTDFAAELQGVPNADTDWAAGWWANVANGEDSHEANFQGYSYAIFGSRYWLDLLYDQGNRLYSYNNYGGCSPSVLCDGYRDDYALTPNHYYGLYLACCQTRGSARAIWDKVMPAALGGDGNIERSYYNDIITEMGNYYQHWLAAKDGAGNNNMVTGILAPDWIGSGYVVDTFITNYLMMVDYAMATHLHAPMAASWGPNMQRFYEGLCGQQMYGSPISYYCIDYITLPNVHNADFSIQGANIGQYLNGVDASDFGNFSGQATVLTGGQLQQSPSYHLTNGDMMKWANGVVANGAYLIDQLPGDTWFHISNVNSGASTYYVTCPVGHAVTSTCPVPGQPFTGFTRGGVPVTNEAGENVAYRLQYDPGAGAGYADNSYGGTGKLSMNALQILGYDMTAAQSTFAVRWGSPPTPNYLGSSQWWDPTVVVAGLPAVVTYGNQFPTLACTVAPGTVVTSLGLIQGNGGAPGAWSVLPTSSDTTHFAISGNNLVTAGSLPCNTSQAIQVQTMQTGGGTVTGQINLHIGA